ncbi:tensin-1 [Nilaparvata lugens]|uniref:tensin-1 n=1 Tax=Nilaparvata lugens TaxID=108931 RepID=UPI00193EBA83|nr:tensin-1 [Nilaparvata lugens]
MGTDNNQRLSRMVSSQQQSVGSCGCSEEGSPGAAPVIPIFLDEVILHLHRIAFTVWHTALHLQQEHARQTACVDYCDGYRYHANDTPSRTPVKQRSSPGSVCSSRRSRSRDSGGMDLSYVTERIIALWFPPDLSANAFRQGQQQAAHMLHSKHANSYMVFNLSEPRRATRSQHERVRELGWPADLAPPLERLCSVCKEIDDWLSGDKQRIAVLHARGQKERIGVVVAAYMHYSNICGSADQALDRFAMKRFLDDKIGDFEQPSHRRYIDYFSGLLSGNIRINSAPLYLTHVTVLGAPAFDGGGGSAGGCRAFVKVYEGLVPVYTSGVHSVSGDTRQFTVNVAGERRRGLQLRGDILLKCYHRHYFRDSDICDSPSRSITPQSSAFSDCQLPQRELIFACQFHTCAVADYTLSFTRQELDAACNDLRFPLDGAVELHFSPTPEGVRQPTPAPTPAVPVDLTCDPVTRWDSYENLLQDTDTEDTNDGEGVSHTYGPLDGSLYATVSKKQAVMSSVHTVSMDSGISSAGNGLLHHNQQSQSADHHRALDELLNDMLLTVENIPDLKQVGGLEEEVPHQEDIPYHARTDSQPFTYGSVPASLTNGVNSGGITNGGAVNSNSGAGNSSMIALSSPSLVRKASFGKGSSNNHPLPHSPATNGHRNYHHNTLPTARSPDFHEGRRTSLSASVVLVDLPCVQVACENREVADFIFCSVFLHRIKCSVFSIIARSIVSGSMSHHSSNNLTWLQRQQAKLRERREVALRTERLPTETRLFSELRSVLRPTPSQRFDAGYTSDTTLFADEDEEDFSVPLHINTNGKFAASKATNGGGSSAPTSPLLPHRTSSQRRGRTERPFVAVKRAHEQSRKYSENSSPESYGLGLPLSRSLGHDADGLLSVFENDRTADDDESVTLNGAAMTLNGERMRQSDSLSCLIANLAVSAASASASASTTAPSSCYGTNCTAWSPSHLTTQSRDDSYSSWRTTSTSGRSEERGGGAVSPPLSSSPRPQTPAFPVHPRTPYASTPTHHFDGLPPKSPTASRKDWSPLAETLQRELSSTSTLRGGYDSSSDQHSPKSPLFHANGSLSNGGGQSSPSVYYGHSRRSSVHSNNEPPHEVSPAHVKFVRDTSKFWYKPTISREEAIAMLRDRPAGTFVVRDSNSFPGAFGLALKVALPPLNSAKMAADPSSELVRHFLIEPTSRGVRLKGCPNEPVFSSLSALVYQHSLMALALPCQLLLPETESSRLPADSPTISTAQMLLAQGAACNVLYLLTVETESLTGPQAIVRAVAELFGGATLPTAAVVHFKVSGQGITLTDNKRQLFFRRHYPVTTISFCGLDPDDHHWNQRSELTGMPVSSNRVFGFVARKPASNTDNQCHIFAELDPEQPATAIVNFVSKVMMNSVQGKHNIV